MSTVGGSPRQLKSHPSRGAWIEIASLTPSPPQSSGRTPHGVRGLKLRHFGNLPDTLGRTPHGVRGLKYLFDKVVEIGLQSRTPHGVRGLKYVKQTVRHHGTRSHPSRGAWIEMHCRRIGTDCNASHPSRGAWIEINGGYRMSCTDSVAPLTGCVD